MCEREKDGERFIEMERKTKWRDQVNKNQRVKANRKERERERGRVLENEEE